MKTKSLNRLEFWIATSVYILALINICSLTAYDSPNSYFFIEEKIRYNVLTNYFIPQTFKCSLLYVSFLLYSFFISPQLMNREKIVQNVLVSLIITGSTILLWMVANTYSKAYILVQYMSLNRAYAIFFTKAFIFIVFMHLLFVAYTFFNEKGQEWLSKRAFLKGYEPSIIQEIFVATRIWGISLIIFAVLLAENSNYSPLILWLVIPPINILVTFYSIYDTIPALRKKYKAFGRYFWGNVGISILICAALALFFIPFMNYGEVFPITIALTCVSLIFLATPLAWFIYKNKFEKFSQIQQLKTELGKSDASLNFLKSQINPHFLFNALNTLFGTALQENAERTGEGIQKLGDMMRFMLHENTLDKIPLSREVEYLNNYIDLQKLRTSRSADIKIDCSIQEQFNNLQITPMLLIPFIENAFKHGISLQQPSYIKISLQTKDNSLFFDISNSIYLKSDNDPEKLKSGIGLENVKQRLNLLYFGKHELVIRETATEFFVHLTLVLE
ncbi:sensor histidine kinase [Pedobacter sp. MW01-1-1]|uniref:sensor histidine kinase n=1 Tax=Pedobacter sp. MW01-1-1 TaxID=3383027 RepID=UPI003FEFE8C6